MSDGTLQVIGGLEMGVSFDGAWLETEAKYNMRGGDFTDEVLLHFEAGFSNIPRTYLKTFADAVISVKNFDGVRPFNVAQSQLQETTYNFGGSFTAFITENWFLDASYSLRLWGYNSWILRNCLKTLYQANLRIKIRIIASSTKASWEVGNLS